jgi:quercetin dioxygenase-like cupin family protein
MSATLGKLHVRANGVGCQAVSQDGQASWPDDYCAADDAAEGAAVIVATFPMPPGLVFDWHIHPDHQLAWAASGVLTVRTDASTWVLPPTRALWIPAGLRHETLAAGAATMRSAYVRPDGCAIAWPAATPVVASPLLAELIGYLESRDLAPGRRANAEAVLVDLLEPVAMTTVEVRSPADDRARRVADGLAANPADDRTLADWGHSVGASERVRCGHGRELWPLAYDAARADRAARARRRRTGRQRRAPGRL